MRIAFNPSTVAALIAPPNNKDITFDLRGQNIFARGVKFCGTDTNTWRDIKINNISIDSNILDLRDGDNTTLTNINGVVTINSTWRPVVDNLTSDSTTSSLSANLGRVLVGLINTLSTNISNLYALRDGSNATGRWRGGLACLDVRDTNYTPHDLNMGLELHFFNNETNNLKDGGVYNGVFSFRQWASESNWTGGKAHLLSFTDNGNIWHRTSSGDDSWETWKKLAYFTDIPSSLKNPYALTISLNGTSQGPYDGSAAKNINITPSSIGAATSEHNHDGRYVYNYGSTAMDANSLNKNALGISSNSGIGNWWCILQAGWNNEYRWNSLIAFPTLNRNGMYYRSGLDDNTTWGAWVKLLDVNNYSSTLDSRYYTESEVDSLLDAKLNRQNLSYGTWNPRGYNLAADYLYNGGDLSISESGGLIHVSVDGYFWLNEGLYRVLDTSDIGGIQGSITILLYLSNTDTNWYPLIWGGNDHRNTYNSTGGIYKSHDVLSWLTSSLTLYATNLYTGRLETVNNHYYHFNSDATLRIYGSPGDNSERIYFLAGIDNRIDDYDIPSYGGELRHSIILNPRGGYVGIGDTNPSYKLSVGGDIGTGGNIYISHNTNNNMNYDTSNPRIVFSENGRLAVGLVYTDYDSYRLSKGLKVMDVNNDDVDNVWFEVLGYNYSSGYVKNGSNDNYILLGGGGHKLESALSVANADTVDGYHASSFVRAGHYESADLNNLDTYSFIRSVNSNNKDTSPKGDIGWYNVILLVHRNGNADGPGYIGLIALGMTTNTNDMFFRGKRTDPWKMVIHSGNIGNQTVASATKLQTSRKIWGQSFDGTGNVDGLLTITSSELDKFIHVHDGKDGPGFKAIRFYKNNSDIAAIHWFNNNFEGYAWNDNCINIDPYAGGHVTIGNWQNPDILVTRDGNIGIKDNSPAYKFSVAGDIYSSATIRTAAQNQAIVLSNNSSPAWISALNGQIIFNTGKAIRFGETDWDWNKWAGLKYTHSNKTIYLGIADNSIFIANSALSGGSLRFPGISNVYAPTFKGSLSGNASSASKWLTASTFTIGNTSKSVDGSSNVSWSLSEIGAASSSHTHDDRYLKLEGGTMLDLSRIGVNGDLYIGDAGNGGWLYFQDIASLDGTDYWSISTDGSATFEDISTRSDISVGGLIYRGGIDSSWNKGRDNALLRDTSSSGYHALWSLKTTNGSWDFGEYNKTEWNNIPVLSYITDTQYNGSSPTYTYQIRFPLASGTVALTSNIPNPTDYYWADVKVSSSPSTTTFPTFLNLATTNKILRRHRNLFFTLPFFAAYGLINLSTLTFEGNVACIVTKITNNHFKISFDILDDIYRYLIFLTPVYASGYVEVKYYNSDGRTLDYDLYPSSTSINTVNVMLINFRDYVK